MSYRNPILPGFNPDPSMIYHEGHYYLVTSSFEYFPGIPIYRSDNLIDWTLIGHVLTRRSQLDLRECEPGGGIFAPCLRYNKSDKRFYVVVCALHRMKNAVPGFRGGHGQPRGFYVSTDDIEKNNWTDPTYIDALGIDQDLFFDDDGKTYMSVARSYPSPSARFNLGTFTSEIDLAHGGSITPSVLARISETEIPVAEGPHIFKKDGVYYLIVAEGGTEICHQEWIMRSTKGPMGPWEVAPKRDTEGGGINPMIFNDHHPEIRQTGHMDLCEGKDGKWWAVFLGVRPQVDEHGDRIGSQLGRETFLAPVEWNSDGWPIVNGGEKVTIQGSVSTQLKRLPVEYSVDYTFAPDKNLALDGWYSLRTPLRSEFSLTHTPGSLTLFGGPYHFRLDEATTMLLIRQRSFDVEWSLTLDFDPQHVDEEAGVAVWWSKWNFASVSIRGDGKRGVVEGEALREATGKELVLRQPDSGTVGEFKETTYPLDASDGAVSIRIVAQPTSYAFYASTAKKDLGLLGTVPAYLLIRLKSPIEWMFTGTHLGLFACGAENNPCLRPAVFSSLTEKGIRAGGA